jgi:phosphatidate cytidylyltransferase
VRDLPRRTVTAAIYAAIVLIAVLAPREVFFVALAVVVVLALSELARLRGAGIAAALELLALGCGAASLLWLRNLTDVPGTFFSSRFGLGPLLMTILAVWAADVVGYAVGSSFGRHRIVPRISPGKTWEGTIAGFLAAAAVVILWNRPNLGIPVWSAAMAVLIGPAAFGGDLLESWVKRRAGVKDSGTLLPGHGGVLDRIDSLIAAATLVVGVILVLGPLG